MSRIIPELYGQRFGLLLVIGRAVSPRGKSVWLCLCDCGVSKLFESNQLTGGRVLSCGCRKRMGLHRTHEHTGSRTYRAWTDLRRRCNNPNRKDFKYYGGRGIRVCQRWDSFENFLADMGECPEGLTIDRINVNGDYESSNCRWATRLEQTRNRRVSVGAESAVIR